MVRRPGGRRVARSIGDDHDLRAKHRGHADQRLQLRRLRFVLRFLWSRLELLAVVVERSLGPSTDIGTDTPADQSAYHASDHASDHEPTAPSHHDPHDDSRRVWVLSGS